MQQQPGYGYGLPHAAAQTAADSRDRFLAKTYHHLFGAIVLFVLIEVGLFMSGIAPVLARAMMGGSWLLVLGAFMLVSWLATRAAHSAQSSAAQYAGLAGYTLAQAIIFVPLLYIANAYAPGAIKSAALVTLVGFGGLTGLVLWTRKDFSFMGAVLRWVGIGALILIVASVIFGFTLGTLFSVGMVVFAGAAILYDTSNILHHYPEDRHVAAALQLFASVALLFWYVLRLFIGNRN